MDGKEFGELMMGGHQVTIMSPDGVSPLAVANEIMLTNDFQLGTVKPGELAANQESAAFILTFKGIDANTKIPKAITVIFEPTMANQLFKALRLKFVEIPIELR